MDQSKSERVPRDLFSGTVLCVTYVFFRGIIDLPTNSKQSASDAILLKISFCFAITKLLNILHLYIKFSGKYFMYLYGKKFVKADVHFLVELYRAIEKTNRNFKLIISIYLIYNV